MPSINKMTVEEFNRAKEIANDWRWLCATLSVPMEREELSAWSRATYRADMDRWLEWRLQMEPGDGRTVSNYSMDETPFRWGSDGGTWVAKRPAPTFTDYPELTVENVLRAHAEESWAFVEVIRV